MSEHGEVAVMPGLFEELAWRGLVHQATDSALAARLDNAPVTAYVGFDPTAPSLQLGNLVGVLNLVRLQRGGHRPIALAGGGTGLVGDPSGKAAERALMTRDELAANLAAIRTQLERFLDFDAGALLLDNGEWLWSLGFLEFLRDVGKHFTVNTMIAKESVRARLEGREQGISYTEFSYMLLQAYDFLHLYDAYDCRLQLGGSDQWGNIVMGVDLIRRTRGGEAYGLTSPLLLDGEGRKLGKTETGTVWLDPRLTSPYALFQYLLNTPDAAVGGYVRALTLLSRDQIIALDEATAERPARREAQRALAREVVALVHGGAEAERAVGAAAALFSEDIAALDEATLLEVVAEAPSLSVARAELHDGAVGLVDALHRAGLVASRAEARRAIEQGGAYVNNRRVGEVDRVIGAGDLLHGRYVILRRGRRQHALVRVEG